MKKYISVFLLLLVAIGVFASEQRTVWAKLDDGTDVEMTFEEANAFNAYMRMERYFPEKYENPAIFAKAFSNTTALNEADKEFTRIHMDFLGETFAWLDVLKANGKIAAGTDAWETTNLDNLSTMQVTKMELLSVSVYNELQKFIGALDAKLGQKFQSGTPLDIGRQNAPILNKGTRKGFSLCAATFDAGCKAVAEAIRADVNRSIKGLNASATDRLKERSTPSKGAASKDDLRAELLQRARGL